MSKYKTCRKCNNLKHTSDFPRKKGGGTKRECTICRRAIILRKAKQKEKVLNPYKYEAREAINYLIRKGKVPKAKELICHTCNDKALEYHHVDYTKPLIVVPLCKTCHSEVHKISEK